MDIYIGKGVIMKIRLLGSAASEGYPAIFCHCRACKKARQLGGKNIRTRTSALIDGHLKIDFPPDSFMHTLRYGVEVMNYTDLIITHSHHDHFYPEDLRMRLPGFAHNYGPPLKIYGNGTVIEKCDKVFGPTDELQLQQLEMFKTVTIADALITPLQADHKPDEESFIFHIEKSGKEILYGHDTGIFPSESYKWLANKEIDLAILDCTNGLLEENRNHMNIMAIQEIKTDFTEKGIFHKDTRVVATHFSHNINLSHHELEELLHPSGIEVAYDGKEILL